MNFSKLLIGALGLTASLFGATAVIGAEATAKSGVNVRSGPGTGYRVVDSLHTGEVVDVGRCAGSWCEIIHPGPDGWVSANFLLFHDAAPPERRRLERRGGGDPDVSFCVDAPNFSFGVNCDAAPSPSPTPPPSTAEVCFFDGPNYRGDSFCAEPGDGANRLGVWNDRITSIRIRGDAVTYFCQNAAFTGLCNRINRSIPRLTRLDNAISSFRVE